MLSKVNLTDRFLKSIKTPSTGADMYADVSCGGLYLRVGSRKKSWVYEKQVIGGVKRKHTLGSWPLMPLALARETARSIGAEAEQGIDRIELAERDKLVKEHEALSKITTAKVLDRYADLKLNSLSTGTAVLHSLSTSLDAYLTASLSDLTRGDLQQAIDAHTDAKRKVSANRTRAHIRAFTRWAYGRGYLETDIGHALQGAGREEPRDRVLSLNEVRKVYAATYQISDLWAAQFRLLLLTGQRRGEIGDMRWSNLDLSKATITLAGAQTKNRKPHITHLSKPALAELQALSERRSTVEKLRKSEYVFTTTGETPASGVSKGKKALDRALGLVLSLRDKEAGVELSPDRMEEFRLHDFRRAMATALAGEGIAEGVVDRIQNHAASGSAPSAVARTYQQHDLLPDRARALDLWGGLVTGTVTPKEEREEGDVLAFGVRR